MQNRNNHPTYIKQNSTSINDIIAVFMSKVYLWMTLGICLSGLVAVNVASSPELITTIVTNQPIFWGLIIAQFGSVMFLSMAMDKINSIIASLVYLAYAALTGMTISTIFLVYAQESIASVFMLTAFSFAGLSTIGFVTKRDLGPVGSFCSMGLFGMIGLALISIFFPSLQGGTTGQIYNLVGIIVFSGLTAYDTQKIKSLAFSKSGPEEQHKGAIYGALILYLDFINLFLSILRLMGRRK